MPAAHMAQSDAQHLVAECACARMQEEGSRESVDAKCRRLTAAWVREKASEDTDIETCTFNEALDAAGPEAVLDPGVYTLHDMRAWGRKKGWCPYYLARHMLAFANVIVYNYQYMLDPKVRRCSLCNALTDHTSFDEHDLLLELPCLAIISCHVALQLAAGMSVIKLKISLAVLLCSLWRCAGVQHGVSGAGEGMHRGLR